MRMMTDHLGHPLGHTAQRVVLKAQRLSQIWSGTLLFNDCDLS